MAQNLLFQLNFLADERCKVVGILFPGERGAEKRPGIPGNGFLAFPVASLKIRYFTTLVNGGFCKGPLTQGVLRSLQKLLLPHSIPDKYSKIKWKFYYVEKWKEILLIQKFF